MANNKKKDKKFTRTMQKKLVVLFAGIIVVFIGLNVRIAQINAKSGDEYTKSVLSQQEYTSTVLPYRRGDIVDRKGTVLATSERVFNVILDTKQLLATKDEAHINKVISSLVSCFQLDEAQIRQYISENPDNAYYILKKQLTKDDKDAFEDLFREKKDDKTKAADKKDADDTKADEPKDSEAEDGAAVADADTDTEVPEEEEEEVSSVSIKGVWFEKDYVRKYPYGSLAADEIGFTSSGNVGNGGMEGYYNSTLNGINGREYGYLNDELELERTVKEAIDGNTLVSTLDVNIQSIVEKYIREFNEAHRDEARPGDGSKLTAVMMMNPNTGEVLAMASTPEWDLNNPRDLTPFYSEEEIAAMDDETRMDALNKIWRNFCISDTYEPGSTSKPFTIASGLETGKLNGNETFVCDGKQVVPGAPKGIACVNRYGHGLLTIEGAINVSCNDALMQMAAIIGTENFCRYQEIFGFGQKTRIDLPGEANTSGMLYTADKMKPVDLATNSFGQNYNVTMIQQISAFCSVINGGYYYQPHMVSRILDASGGTVQNIDPILLKQTISEKTSATLKQYLYTTVSGEKGTAKKAAVPGYKVGGKTGTAEKYPREDRNFLVSYLGYAPFDKPQVVIYVVIDEPNVEEQNHASSLACEMANGILSEVLPYMNIFPTEEIPEDTAQDGQQDPASPQTDPGAQDGQEPQDTGTDGQSPEEGGQDGQTPEDGQDGEGADSQAPEDGGPEDEEDDGIPYSPPDTQQSQEPDQNQVEE
ncbi:penicillin-binding transpeptidase domain-containing protein [Diplocloster agilis]|uniref:Peptidoglycan glycosyltransferase n=1 Tax=Diplocloster agilis TaxID=2850323 RepID=A0A949K3J8_9FIRM|nr:peptidoglycan glycosyltransferase [Diplocloster agilis]